MKLFISAVLIVAAVHAGPQCQGDADKAAWISKKASFNDDMATCGKKCWGGAKCISDCIQKKEGYSKSCAACFGDLAGCTKSKCFSQCIGGNSPGCRACVAKSCETPFAACSGIPASDMPQPTGSLVPLVSLWSADPKPPNFLRKALTARWLSHNTKQGVLSTTSLRYGGQAFGNVQSHVDGPVDNGTGTLYFYVSEMDESMKDLAANPNCSYTITEESAFNHCSKANLDGEDPRCARMTLVGEMVELDAQSGEYSFARGAMFARHPQMKSWPADHSWKIKKLALKEVWLIDFFGGATIIKPADYYTAH